MLSGYSLKGKQSLLATDIVPEALGMSLQGGSASRMDLDAVQVPQVSSEISQMARES